MKVYNALKRATEHKGQPTVILTKTVKGYGLGEAGEGKNITHQQKKLNEEELFYLANRFNLELTKEQIHEIAFIKPDENSPEMRYLIERRQALCGYLPIRAPKKIEFKAPPL
jgi:pyruvate dehydrogenase E1 component